MERPYSRLRFGFRCNNEKRFQEPLFMFWREYYEPDDGEVIHAKVLFQIPWFSESKWFFPGK